MNKEVDPVVLCEKYAVDLTSYSDTDSERIVADLAQIEILGMLGFDFSQINVADCASGEHKITIAINNKNETIVFGCDCEGAVTRLVADEERESILSQTTE